MENIINIDKINRAMMDDNEDVVIELCKVIDA